MKYIDLIAYPIMLVIVYVLVGFLNWNKDPDSWMLEHRAIWILWGMAWGYALQCRIKRGGTP